MKKREIILIAVILVIAGLLWLFTSQPWKKKDIGSIKISVYGKEFGEYPLSEDQVINIESTNVCEIKDGKAFMQDSYCPDHLCEHMPYIDGVNGGLIVCLPNQVIIEGIKAKSSDGVDAIE